MGAGERAGSPHRAAQAPVVQPEELAARHRATAVDATVELRAAVDVVIGAGFAVEHVGEDGVVTARRLRTLPDRVGPGMRLLVCGLNPSLYSADRGFGFARPGNRFWPAMRVAAGVSDPNEALREGIGMTDLVKRATVAAAELTRDEYAEGVARVERLCAALQPGALLVVGFSGWRAAVDKRATAGWQPSALGGVAVYVMPNTSGLNASTQHDGFVEHLRAALRGPADRGPGSVP